MRAETADKYLVTCEHCDFNFEVYEKEVALHCAYEHINEWAIEHTVRILHVTVVGRNV